MSGCRLTGDCDVGAGGLLDVGTDETENEVTSFHGSHWLSANNSRAAASLRCDWLAVKRRRDKHERLERLNVINTRRCDQFVVYGTDVHRAVDCLSLSGVTPSSWSSAGFVHCLEAQLGSLWPSVYWRQTDSLKQAVHTPEDYLRQLRDVLDR